MTEVSVVTWNLHHGVDHRPASMERTWGYLRDTIRPTVALIQEADGVPYTAGGSVVTRADSVGYETAVVAYEGRLEPVSEATSRYSKQKRSLPLGPTVLPTHAVAGLEPRGAPPLVAVSLYGRIVSGVYSQTSVLHAVADLLPLLDDPRHNRRMVVGGDLNVFDNGPRVDRVSRNRWAVIFELFRSMGLVNLLEHRRAEQARAGLGPLPGCLCAMGDACYQVETWRARRGVPGVWCLDYLFATKDLADRMSGPVEVWGSCIRRRGISRTTARSSPASTSECQGEHPASDRSSRFRSTRPSPGMRTSSLPSTW